MALNDEIKQVTDNWAVKLSTDLLDSLNKALKEGGSTNPQTSALQFNPVITTTNDGVKVEIVSNYDYWYWVEYGRKKGKIPPSEGAGNTGYDPRGDFLNFWGWYAVVDDITGGDPFKEDEVWSWGVVRFLNRLSYMKDKNEVIAEEIRQRNGIKR